MTLIDTLHFHTISVVLITLINLASKRLITGHLMNTCIFPAAFCMMPWMLKILHAIYKIANTDDKNEICKLEIL